MCDRLMCDRLILCASACSCPMLLPGLDTTWCAWALVWHHASSLNYTFLNLCACAKCIYPLCIAPAPGHVCSSACAALQRPLNMHVATNSTAWRQGPVFCILTQISSQNSPLSPPQRRQGHHAQTYQKSFCKELRHATWTEHLEFRAQGAYELLHETCSDMHERGRRSPPSFTASKMVQVFFQTPLLQRVVYVDSKCEGLRA